MRIFVLGDSFAANLFNDNNTKTKSRTIERYLTSILSNNLPKPMWFTDWLVDFGYEVYNYGNAGSSIEDAIYQFKNIHDEFREGDRIVFWVTEASRFNWITNDYQSNTSTLNGNLYTNIDNDLEMLFYKQNMNRIGSAEKEYGYLRQNMFPFLNYLINIHSKYKPIILTRFSDTFMNLSHNKYIFDFNLLSININRIFSNTISVETNNIIEDEHFGRIPNLFLAHEINEIIKLDLDGDYNNNETLKKNLNYLSFDLDFNFKKPKNWL